MVSRWSFCLALCLAGTAALTFAADPTIITGRRVAVVDQRPVATSAAEEVADESEPMTQPAAMPGAPYQPMAGGPPDEQFMQPGDDDACPLGGCGQCSHCCGESGPVRGFYGRAEALYWWIKGEYTPPLVTSSLPGTPQAAAGVLPNASILFGGTPLNSQGTPGGRFTIGYWFDPAETVGIESTSFFLQQVHTSYNSGPSTGTPIIARPFINADTGANDADLIAFPGLVAGQATSSLTTKALGTEVNFRRMICLCNNRRTDLLLGWRMPALRRRT